MDVVTSLIAVAILLAVLWFVRRNAKPGNVRPDEGRKVTAVSDSKFHAVSIRFGANACEAARKMEGRRFLSSAAPRLPLPECDVQGCQCRFKHHTDRRSGDDRRNAWGQGLGTTATGQFSREQRKGGDRRNDDPDDHFG